jgi:hypothetical protein
MLPRDSHALMLFSRKDSSVQIRAFRDAVLACESFRQKNGLPSGQAYYQLMANSTETTDPLCSGLEQKELEELKRLAKRYDATRQAMEAAISSKIMNTTFDPERDPTDIERRKALCFQVITEVTQAAHIAALEASTDLSPTPCNSRGA